MSKTCWQVYRFFVSTVFGGDKWFYIYSGGGGGKIVRSLRTSESRRV